jgi:hypothetical protein
MSTSKSTQPPIKPVAAHAIGEVRSGYQVVVHIRDVDGILGVISMRVSGAPIHTVAIFKIFVRDGEEEKSVFWSATKQGAAARRVLDLCLVRAAELEKVAMDKYDRTSQR